MRSTHWPVWLVLGLALTMAPALAQTCRDDIQASAPDSRFTANGDGTVTDLLTGLIWKQCAEGLSGADCLTGSAKPFTWQGALQHAEATVFAGSDLWRLPNKKELASLMEQRCHDPAINIRFFPNTRHEPGSKTEVFWSSSPLANAANAAWSVTFSLGDVLSYSKGNAKYVRLVRGGQ